MKRSRTRPGPLLLAVAALAAPGVAGAAEQKFENLDRLDGLIATTLGANIGEPGGARAQVDRRLRLLPCAGFPQIDGPVFGAAIVSCADKGWRIRVPLMPGGNSGVGAGGSVAASHAAPRAAREIIVRRGDPVQLIAGGASFTASRAMIADEDGAAGDMIRVREDRKSDPILAKVEKMGIVRAPGFNLF